MTNQEPEVIHQLGVRLEGERAVIMAFWETLRCLGVSVSMGTTKQRSEGFHHGYGTLAIRVDDRGLVATRVPIEGGQ